MSTINKKIFAQVLPEPDSVTVLYTVPANCQAKGTIYISSGHQSHDHDSVSVGLVPATYCNNGIPVSVPTGNTWIASATDFFGTVPIYLQQICLNENDSVVVYSVLGTCIFTYLGDLYTD